MIASINPTSSRRLEDHGPVPVVGRQPKQLELARLLGRVGRQLQFLALEELERRVDAVVTEAVDEEEIDIICAHRRAALVDHAPQLARDVRGLVLLRDDEDLLADGGLLLKPGLEVGFGLVGSGGVEGADPLTVRVAEQAADAASPPGADVQQGDLGAGLAEGSLGKGGRQSRGGFLGACAGVRLAAEAVDQRPGLEECTAVTWGHVVVCHCYCLLRSWDGPITSGLRDPTAHRPYRAGSLESIARGERRKRVLRCPRTVADKNCDRLVGPALDGIRRTVG